MKKQYLGDIRDLFKFDIASFMFVGETIFRGFSYIPMLTPNDDGNDGRFRNYRCARAGTHNNKLMECLSMYHSQDRDQRDFGFVQQYFENAGTRMEIYGKKAYFSARNREAYFERIPERIVAGCLVFIDPDNGMEMQRSDDRHILFSEIEMVLGKGDERSAVSVIQFRKIKERNDYWGLYRLQRRKQLEAISRHVVSVSDNRVCFYYICQSRKALDFVETRLQDYKKTYAELQIL